jgi:uncharacterized BrkB/YihY/UPF0761 family membrane protein
MKSIGKIKGTIIKETEEFKKEVQTRTMGYILAGFGLVTGLAWNDAIKSTIAYFFPEESRNSLVAQYGYALALTLVLVVVSVYLARLFMKKEEPAKK